MVSKRPLSIPKEETIMEKMTIGKFIAALRRARGMTQKELGEKLFVSDKTVSRWERDECDPELSLIPAIAEIFGITTDELLRGQRRSEDAAPPTPEAAARQKSKSDKQWRSLLQRRLTHYRSLALITGGVALTGLVVAVICDLAFTRAWLGFGLALVFLIAAAIMALCFTFTARLTPDEDEPERHGDIAQFNAALTRTCVALFSLIGGVLAFLLPLLLAGAYYGLGTGSWLLLGLICVAVALIAGHLLYTAAIRPALVKKGLLLHEDGERSRRDCAALRRLLKITLPATAAGIVLIILLEALGTQWLAKGETFDNYADFEAYAAQMAYGEDVADWIDHGYTVVPLPDGYEIRDWNGKKIHRDEFYLSDTIRSEDGKLLATYLTNGISMVSHSFHRSPDGLPITAYSNQAMHQAFGTQKLLQGICLCAIALTWLVCTVVYLKKRRAV